jgi:hypothetical protein
MKEVLVIVDVQVSFRGVTDTYVDGIKELCETFDEVYQIWDSNDVNSPDFKFPNEVDRIRKEYGGFLAEEDIDDYEFSEKDKARLKEGFAENHFNQGELFANGTAPNRNWFLYVGDTANHPWFIFEEKLFQLFEELKNEGKTAILCGGARMECLYDIEILAEAVGLDATVLGTHTY